MIDGSTTAPYAGLSITNTKIAHSKSDGIASAAAAPRGLLNTDYNKADVTFDDIAGKTLGDNGVCN